MAAPLHWSDAWLGIPYDTKTANCGTLCERVMRDVYGRPLGLPTEIGDTWQDHTAVIAARRDDFMAPVATPAEGDCVMMIGRGRVNHLGIYCVIGPEAYVLHAMEAAGESVRHRIRDLPRLGLGIEGYYRWK